MKNRIFYPLIALLFLCPALLQAQSNNLRLQLENAIKDKKAEVGIAVILDGKDTITVNNNARYPLMSVFKFHQALALADYMSQRNIPLDTRLHIEASDLKPNTYSPLRDKYPQGDIDLSIAELLEYTLQQSDNNACDILFHYQGSPESANKYIHSLGVDSCSIAFTENDMHEDINRCYQNWSTPLAAAQLLEIFLNQPLFGKTYKDFIYQTMTECKTGADRLFAPLSGKNVIIGHKTGTGDKNDKGQLIAINDIGFVILPDKHTYSIAVFVKNSEESPKVSSEIIAEISRIVYDYVNGLQ